MKQEERGEKEFLRQGVDVSNDACLVSRSSSVKHIIVLKELVEVCVHCLHFCFLEACFHI
jgi:hypothetical protein